MIHTFLQHRVDDLSILHDLQISQKILLEGSNHLPVAVLSFARRNMTSSCMSHHASCVWWWGVGLRKVSLWWGCSWWRVGALQGLGPWASRWILNMELQCFLKPIPDVLLLFKCLTDIT